MLKIEESFQKITTETLLATMFKFGFDKIDPALLVYTLEELNKSKKAVNKFDFSEEKLPSIKFPEYIRFNGLWYKPIKNKSEMEEYYKKHVNDDLLKEIEKVDFVKIVDKKLTEYGVDGAYMCPLRFSKKEMKIKEKRIKEISEYIEQINEAADQRAKDKESMKYSTEYIDWLIEFTNKQEEKKFTNIDFDYSRIEATEEEEANASKLSSLIDVIALYFEGKYDEDCDCSCFKIAHNGTVMEIGEIHHNGTILYAKIADDKPENVLNYETMIEYFKKIREIYADLSQLEESPKTYRQVLQNPLTQKREEE